jgi:hypothetical protein
MIMTNSINAMPPNQTAILGGKNLIKKHVKLINFYDYMSVYAYIHLYS